MATTTRIIGKERRTLAAWRPEWQRKKPSWVKIASTKTRVKKRQAVVNKEVEKLKDFDRRQKRLITFQPEPPDSVFDKNTHPQKNHLPDTNITSLSNVQTFFSTNSPFVYLTHDPKDIYQSDSYWNFNPLIRQDSTLFRLVPSSELDNMDSIPNPPAQVAFLGRSNVGKSSLMNALMRDKLARTSKLPGRTQQVMHYGMFSSRSSSSSKDPKPMGFLVDLPGYGYAFGPDEAVDSWQKNTQNFLLNNTEYIRRLYLLLDARQTQQTLDWAIFKWLDGAGCRIPYTVVLTKADAVGRPSDLIPQLNSLTLRFQHLLLQSPAGNDQNVATGQSPVIHITSAKKNIGIAELWKSVSAELARPIQTE